MPLYEYRCGACGHVFEVLQKIGDRRIRKCEACGRLKAKRAISQTSFVLKGSGWYVTDYGGRKAGTARDESPDKSAGGSGDTSSSSDKSSDSSSSKGSQQKAASVQ
jgi:putative FmdB family regulatory protein